MKRFEFALQKVLNLREFYEKQAEMELARAISVKDTLDAELFSIASSRFAAYNERSNCSLEDLITIEQYVNRLMIRKEKTLVELVQAEIIIEQKRIKMLEAMQKRKVLSNLQENKKDEYKKTIQQNEDNMVDDIKKDVQDI